MVSARVVASKNGVRVVADPDPSDVAKALGKISKETKKKMGQLHKKLAETPIEEIQRRASSAPRGQVRIGRFVKASAAAKDVTVLGGRGAADFAGQVWGSTRFKRFAPYTGGPYENTYVIGAMLSDTVWMESFAEKYADGLQDLVEVELKGVF